MLHDSCKSRVSVMWQMKIIMCRTTHFQNAETIEFEPNKGMPCINIVVLITSNFTNANNIVNVDNIKRANILRNVLCGKTASEKSSLIKYRDHENTRNYQQR